MQILVIDEMGREVPVQGSVPAPRPGYKAVAVGAKNGTTVFRYVPETAPSYGPPGYSPDMSPTARAAADSVFAQAPTPLAPEGQGAKARVASKAKGFRAKAPIGEEFSTPKPIRAAEAPYAVKGGEYPRPERGGDLERFGKEPIEQLSGQAPDLGPTGLPPDPLAKFGKEDELPPEPPILKSAEAATEALPEDPLQRFRDKEAGSETSTDKLSTPPGGSKSGKIPWTSSSQSATEESTPVIHDKESLAEYKKIGEMGAGEARKQYERYLQEIEGPKAEEDRQRFRGERQAALDRYTQGLDRAEKTKLVETIISGLGKFAAGYAGQKTGTPVGKYYETVPTGISEFRERAAKDKYGAEMSNIAAEEKGAGEARDLKLQARSKAIDYALSLPKAHQEALYRLLQLTSGAKRMGITDSTNFLSAENLQMQLEKMSQEEQLEWLRLKTQHVIAAMADKRARDEGRAERENRLTIAREGNRAALQRASVGAVSGQGRSGSGDSTTITRDPKAFDRFVSSNAVGNIHAQPVLQSAAFQDYKAANDLDGAKRELAAQLSRKTRFRNKEEAAPFSLFLTNLNAALPHIKTFEQLENIGTTMDNMGLDPDSVFGPKLYTGKTTYKGIQPPATPPAPPPPQSSETLKTPGGREVSASDAIKTLEAGLADPSTSPEVKARIQEKLRILRGGK